MSVIKTSRDGAVATVTIDRPAEGNLLSIPHLRELAAAFHAVAADDAKVVVLRANGADFCKGRDSAGAAPSPTALKLRANVLQPILDVYDAMENTPQPIVCLVQGAAFGFGAAIAGAADVTIADDSARFKLPEMAIDLPPTLAVSALMPKVARKALTWMVYAMEELDAPAAREVGLVSKVVPRGGLDTALADLLKTMLARSPEALIAVKDFFRTAPYMEPRGVSAYAGTLLAAVLSSAGK